MKKNEIITKQIHKLALIAEHYYVIEEISQEKKCEYCGRIYKDEHKCDVNKILYYNDKIKKQDIDECRYIKPLSKGNKIDEDIVEKMFIFDLETFAGENDAHNIYALGYTHMGKYEQVYGKNSGDMLLEKISSLNGVTFSAFNGSRFDFYFILKHIARTAVWHKFILDGGRLLSIEWYNKLPESVTIKNEKLISDKLSPKELKNIDKNYKNKIFDIYCHVMTSLKNACESYELIYKKSEFDHTKMKNWECVEKYRKEVEQYLQLDVLSLKGLIQKYQNSLKSENIEISKYITSSSMGFSIWKKTLREFYKKCYNMNWSLSTKITMKEIKKNLIFLQDEKLYEFIRKAIIGGRCYPKQKYFESKFYKRIINAKTDEERKKLYNEVFESGDYVFAADIVSMYPTCMIGVEGLLNVEYPLGQCHMSENPEKEFKDSKLGF
ncbi:MAG: DNA polymerase, partial [Nitrososphaeraceae archaeon]